jgi:hypothetical protein
MTGQKGEAEGFIARQRPNSSGQRRPARLNTRVCLAGHSGKETERLRLCAVIEA